MGKREYIYICFVLQVNLVIFLMNPALSVAKDSSNHVFASELGALYGISEEDAITRLAREADAIDLAAIIAELEIPGYAGSWFDGKDLILKVGTTNPEGEDIIRRLGAEPVQVHWSIEELRAAYRTLSGLHKSKLGAGASIRRLAMNHQRNVIEIGVVPGSADEVLANIVLAKGLDARQLEVNEVFETAGLSSGLVRGAMGTRNQSFANATGNELDEYPCSVGATVVELSTGRSGYVTAGHCGYPDTKIVSPTGTPIGTTIGSDWDWPQSTWGPKDGGWVETEAGWSLLPEIIGYEHGTFSIPAQWSGLQEAIQGTSVCRYGQTSGGGNWSCGTVNARDVQYDASAAQDGSIILEPAIEVSGSCTDDGDSGGPWVSASTHQFQGTNIGGRPDNTCPTQATHVYIYPIKEALTDYQLTMLTSHGANPPTIHGFNCPDPANSGGGVFFCEIDHFKAQGQTTMLWTSGFGNPSSGSLFFGTCDQYDWVTVDFLVSNDYGSAQESAGFVCPTGPPP